jgi:RNA polymerase sigma factor (TIGR02999 family)
MTPSPEEVTRLLKNWRNGDESALDQLMPLVYDELHRMAARYMRRERAGHTLQTSALVNEAYLRLVGRRDIEWQNRAHFFAVAAQVMRRLLVDYARGRKYAKRGGDRIQVTLDEGAGSSKGQPAEVLALHEALEKLAAVDRRKSQLVELRYFGGMSVEETAEVLGVSGITVKREWLKAKAWLYREIERGASLQPDPPQHRLQGDS